MRVTRISWTPEQDALLVKLANIGASVTRATAALRRSRQSVQKRALDLGVKLQTLPEQRQTMRKVGALPSGAKLRQTA